MKYQHTNVLWYQCNDVKETTLNKVLNMDAISTYGEYKMYPHHGNGHDIIKRLLYLSCVRISTMLSLFAFAKVDLHQPMDLIIVAQQIFPFLFSKVQY
jgi:hypothetical protein